MTPQERPLTIREPMELSNNLFESGGNTLVAAELLWGAMAHGLIAIAALRGWRCEGRQGLTTVATLADFRMLRLLTVTSRFLPVGFDSTGM